MKRAALFLLFLLACFALYGQSYYTGEGGRGIRIAVLAPQGQNLSKDEAYLPILIQNWLTGGFNKFSAMTVIDRQNQEAVLGEQKLSAGGNYSDADYIRIGNLTNARYVVAGTVIKVSAAQFSLQLAVTDAETGVRLPGASFMKNCSPSQLRSASVINEACAELLGRLGVTLTEAGKKELSGGAAASVEAETSLARGITAQINGGTVEALSYYYQAAAFDPGLAEAASRLSTLSTAVTGGGFARNLRNDIEARREWLAILKECAAFYQDHLPFEVGYDPNLQSSEVDYAKETVTLSCRVQVSPSEAGFKPLNDLLAGLSKTGKRAAWGLDGWPFLDITPPDPEAKVFGGNRNFSFVVNVALLNEAEKALGTAALSFNATIPAPAAGASRIALPQAAAGTLRFPGIKAADVTDTMTVKIVSVNGVPAETAAERGYVRLVDLARERTLAEARRRAEALLNRLKYETRDDGVVITEYTGEGGGIVIPERLNNLPVIVIGASAFREKNLTGVTIPGSVKEIGAYAFSGNQLTSVAIPGSVTSIGGEAFYSNQLTSVTIPDSVTEIADSAFRSNQLASVAIPDSVTVIGKSAFAANQLTSVIIPNSVTTIEYYAFANNQLTSVTIPGSVTSIGKWAFLGNQLTSVTISDSVTWIGENAFANKIGPQSITIGAKVTVDREKRRLRRGTIYDGFVICYNSPFRGRKRAGTYVYDGRRWRRQ
ncbi:MAG: leucine-rich repeat protein [Treponema sp.]|jgi:hypothetical protein|nr:leucine-rich repeat protein [Treponema sp.]